MNEIFFINAAVNLILHLIFNAAAKHGQRQKWYARQHTIFWIRKL